AKLTMHLSEQVFAGLKCKQCPRLAPSRSGGGGDQKALTFPGLKLRYPTNRSTGNFLHEFRTMHGINGPNIHPNLKGAAIATYH
ncbi:hypothetical protein, partial [Pseudomonas edaphica]|uniref:hypothetical protein n=1 Tax=Pseudomonas edaphica TaxID=2006980 RepID=UPI001981C228